jgi:hypothetical protein
MAGHDDQGGAVLREARRFQTRFRRALVLRGAAMGALIGSIGAGLLSLAGRFLDLPQTAADRGLFLLVLTALTAAGAGFAAARRTPPLSACLAALDAAGRAGGLMMSIGLPGAEAWHPIPPPSPRVIWRSPRIAGGLALSAAFCLLTAILPQRLFVGLVAGGRPTVAAVTEHLAARIAQIEEEHLLPEQSVAAVSNQLAAISQTGDVADPARTLEALDHIAEELTRAADAQAGAQAEEQAALQSAVALAEQLAARLDGAPQADTLAATAAEALAKYLASAPIPAALASNLLAAALAPGGLSPESLRDLAGLLREAGALNESRLARLGELKLGEASTARRSSSGSCTNAAACAGALARLLDADGPAAEAAASLAALCAAPGTPGAGGVTRGRGDAALTWTDPSTTENAAFKKESLASRMPAADQARLEGLSAAAPEVPAAPAATGGGVLAHAAAARGAAPQAPVLPRHRETVGRFFEP